MARARCDTIRLKLLKIGAQVRITFRKMRVAMAESCPYRRIFRQVYENLVGTRAILARMLGNLYTTYVQSGDSSRTTLVLRRIVALRPQDAMVRAELGRMQVLTGDLRGAAATVHQALDLADSDDEKSTVNHHICELRARMHEQN